MNEEAQFQAQVDELRNIASRISNLRDSAEATASNLDRQVESIKEGWQGDAGQIYAAKYTDLHTRLSNAVKSIEEIETALNRAADSFGDVDNQVKANNETVS